MDVDVLDRGRAALAAGRWSDAREARLQVRNRAEAAAVAAAAARQNPSG